MTTLCLLVLVIGLAIQGWQIRSLEKEIEAIKSWYPFCEIMKIRISEDKGGDPE